jgi:hypothetical protein
MTQYLAKRTGQDASVLQSRTFLFFWKDIAYGPTHTMTILAMQLERERLTSRKGRRLFERRISTRLT